MRIKESSKKTLYLVLGLLLLSICSLTIVYAALSAVLRISGNSEVVASSWDIHLANPEVKSGSVHNNLPIINGNSLSFNTTLSLPGDFYEFTVDVVNDGSIDAMIDSVSITPELTTEQAKYIRYEVSYQNGESINTKQTLSKGTSTPIKVRVEYRKDISASDLPSNETNLSIKVTLNYVQSDGSGSEIVNNGKVSALRVVSGDGTQVGNEVCIAKECFYVIGNDGTNVSMLAKYNLNVGYVVEDGSYELFEMEDATGIQDRYTYGARYDWETGERFPFYGLVAFSSLNYWSGSYPSYVYNNNSLIYNYNEEYLSYLKKDFNNIKLIRLIKYEELINLGCNLEDRNCMNAPSWVYDRTYWTGTAYTASGIITVYELGDFHPTSYNLANNLGVRPVIEIPVSEFN